MVLGQYRGALCISTCTIRSHYARWRRRGGYNGGTWRISANALDRRHAPSGGLSFSTMSQQQPFSIVQSFEGALQADSDLPMSIAAIYAMSELISKSPAETTSELMESIKHASDELKASLENPIPATAGLDLFIRFVTTKNWAGGVRLVY